MHDSTIRDITLAQRLWVTPSRLLLPELEQSLDEGKSVDDELIQKIKRITSGDGSTNQEIEKKATELINTLQSLPTKQDYSYTEPSKWEEISLTFKTESHSQRLSTAILSEKIYGGWLGKCIGCLLGKPIEGWKKSTITDFLVDTNNYPIKRYLFDNVDGPYHAHYKLHDKIWHSQDRGMPEDDDVNYLLISLKLVERFGIDFTPEQVAENWLDNLPILRLFTAERIAYSNFTNGLFPPQSALFCNPYREWIGAQIRGDFFGYISPGNPYQAVKLAWKDACVSHVKNGIYGEMWIAAIVALTPTTSDMRTSIHTALSFIPKQSRFYIAICKVLDWFDEQIASDVVIDHIHAIYSETKIHDWCHVIPNAMIVTASLLWGSSDFEKSLNIAITAGFDTDCNGATVGSILGFAHGSDDIPPYWKKMLDDTIYSGVHEMNRVKISEMADRTLRLITKDLPKQGPLVNDNLGSASQSVTDVVSKS